MSLGRKCCSVATSFNINKEEENDEDFKNYKIQQSNSMNHSIKNQVENKTVQKNSNPKNQLIIF